MSPARVVRALREAGMIVEDPGTDPATILDEWEP
jgi:hypothetical protein